MRATLATDDTLFFGAKTKVNDGTDTVVAVKTSDGSKKWTYFTDNLMWNFSPSTPGDGGLIFSSACGHVMRLSSDGKLMWEAGTEHHLKMCVPGGGALGPNGLFYAEYSEGATGNAVDAYNLADGSHVWRKDLPYRAAQYPAVGHLGPNGPLAVVVPMGDNPVPPLPPGTWSWHSTQVPVRRFGYPKTRRFYMPWQPVSMMCTTSPTVLFATLTPRLSL